jgi:hypothetical protein
MIEKARLNNGRVFIHCLGLYFSSCIHFIYYLCFSLAGISRSPALAIAYIMRYLYLSADNAYQYVKQRRSQISPNFNFLGQLFQYENKLSISTTTPIVKCVTIETPVNDRRRFVQVEGCSNTDHSIERRINVLSRPKTLLSPSSTITNLSIESSQQQNSLKTKLSRPDNISLKYSKLELINSSCDELNDKKRIETISKSADTSSLIEQTDLINTYFQESTKSLEEWKPAQSIDSTSETTKTNVLSSSCELLVL